MDSYFAALDAANKASAAICSFDSSSSPDPASPPVVPVAAAAAGGLARKAPARLELPFKLDRANMAALLATPAAARTALRVLSSFLGTDFIH